MNAEISEEQRNYGYIDKYWEILAACAWREYEAHGRGALVIGALEDPEDSIYFPLELLTADPLLKDFAQLAERYDPRQEVVMIFLQQPPSIRALKGGIPGRGTPPELYERLKPVLDEK